MHAPTGEQILLEHGAVRAEIGSVGAVLRSLRVDGVDLTESVPAGEAPEFCNGVVLSPWPNRVRDARWMLDGAVQQLDITEPVRGGALHGVLQFAEYEVRGRTTEAVTLGARIAPQHGWPFELDTWVRYEVVDDGLTVTHGVENRAARPAPYAVGTHPYLRIGDVPIAELRLTVPASRFFEVDERMNPTAESPVDGTGADVRTPRPVGELDLDTAFGGLTLAPLPGEPDASVRGASAWLEAPDGRRLTLWQNADWGFVQVFTTQIFPKAGERVAAVAGEPMTAPPDALNSGQGLIWLEPGERWEGSWGLVYGA